jgi:hypothetical protein
LSNADILCEFVANHNFVDIERIEHGSPLRLSGLPVNVPALQVNGQLMELEVWSEMQTEVLHICAVINFFVWLLLFDIIYTIVDKS